MVDVRSLTVHWHQDNAPIYSACFQPHEAVKPANRTTRLVTAGGDNNIRVWRLRVGATLAEAPQVEYLSTLSDHTNAVNCVAFDPSGSTLASAGDDGSVRLWTLAPQSTSNLVEIEQVETWRLVRVCRCATSDEIYDLAWSPSGKYVAATSMDRVVSVIDISTGSCVAALRDHRHYVQGVAWDPRGELLATQSSDQRVFVYAVSEPFQAKLINRIEKYQDPKTVDLNTSDINGVRFDRNETTAVPTDSTNLAESINNNKGDKDVADANMTDANMADANVAVANGAAANVVDANTNNDKDSIRATDANATTNTSTSEISPHVSAGRISFHPESFSSFFRRLDFSPDGTILVVPAALRGDTECALLFTRGNLRKPSALLPLPKASLAVRFCPTLFKLTTETSLIKLPYRMVFAIATLTGVFLYGTQSFSPLGSVSNLHYSSLTDIAWSPDGRMLLLTSIDGFCSVLRFDKYELGEPLPVSEQPQQLVTVKPVATQAPAAPTPINMLTARKKPKP